MVSIHVVQGFKLALALLAPVVGVVLCHRRVLAIAATSDKMSNNQSGMMPTDQVGATHRAARDTV